MNSPKTLNDYTFSTHKPSEWDDYCARQACFFHQSDWLAMLNQTQGADTLYGWPDGDSRNSGAMPLTISVFKAAMFRAGYIDFPVGNHLPYSALSATNKKQLPTKVHFLRMTASAFNAREADVAASINDTHSQAEDLLTADHQQAQTLPETAITQLPSWQLKDHYKLRREINKSNKVGLEIIQSSKAEHAEIAFQLYQETIKRNQGGMRYKLDYFQGLFALSENTENLRCFIALLDGVVVGFVVAALHDGVAYYMHGGSDFGYRNHGVSPRLLYEAILWAQECNMQLFNFMASPDDQNSLVRFKEKMGGITRRQQSYEIPLYKLQHQGFKLAFNIYTLVNKLRR